LGPQRLKPLASLLASGTVKTVPFQHFEIGFATASDHY